ncbi:hypothetical protein [Leisingera caerulea]|uniref:hypothetical protein n=1 Tax=Leisingera caerulea TaxID=506591 RepID=UPI0004872619|nr:hypothetical protein [Leisingera caerulea]
MKSSIVTLSCVAALALSACAKNEPAKTAARSAPSGTYQAVVPPEAPEARQSASAKPVEGARVEHRLDRVRLGFGDYADSATTAYGLWTNVAEEANPIFAPFGDAVPLLALPAKYGLKKLIVSGGATPARANVSVEAVGTLAACANIATISGAAVAPALVLGVVCGVIYNNSLQKNYEAETGRTIDGLPVEPAMPALPAARYGSAKKKWRTAEGR